jgi:hypothetical protein
MLLLGHSPKEPAKIHVGCTELSGAAPVVV